MPSQVQAKQHVMCESAPPHEMAEVVELDKVTVDGGHEIRSFELRCRDVRVQLCTYGASITRYLVRDATTIATKSTNDDNGNDHDHDKYNHSKHHDDIVLGYDDAAEMYRCKNPFYFGCIVGRVANRIHNGQFKLNEQRYQLEINNPPNHLHGGPGGFGHRIWTVQQTGVIDNHHASIPFVRFSLDSIDGDQGYPGHVQVTATYSLRPSISQTGTTLRLEMNARLLDESNIKTPVNLAQHSYFNLAPSNERSTSGILDHTLLLESDSYTPVDADAIPTRQVVSLMDQPLMDISTKPHRLRDVLRRYAIEIMGLSSERADADLQQRTPSSPYGIDHNYVLRQHPCLVLRKVATLQYQARTLTIHATAPGVQVYTANFLAEHNESSSPHKELYKPWAGICLETQNFPDSIAELNTEMDSIAFAHGRCPVLSPQHRDYEHIVEYTLDHSNGTMGSDTEGRHFDSIESMWAAQDISNWYTTSSEYYQDNCPSTVDGVLGNLGWLSDDDIQGSRTFMEQLNIEHVLKDGIACECGAGIGRVTKGLLLALCSRCDIVESSPRLLSAAPDYIGQDSSRCRYFCSELQNWHPAQPYALVWIQWTAIYLTDRDFVALLKRCASSLVPGGVIVLKENTCADETFVVDVEDASVTRSLPYWRSLVFQAGLRVVKESWQTSFPDDIYPVPMMALRPLSWG